MTIFFTADQHFGHFNIIHYCKRPFRDVPEMNNALTNNWNETVSNSDIVFILGDFAMRHQNEYASQLNGQKVFLCGNHDKRWELSSLFLISNGLHIFMQHSPYLKEVPDGTELILCGHVHHNWKIKDWNKIPIVNVGVDVWDYKPVSLDTIIASYNVSTSHSVD